jgi:hypothetical protein
MSSAGPGTGFSLTYELQADDLRELVATIAQRKLSRTRIIFSTAGWAPVNAAFTAVTVALDLPSVVKNSSGAPSWMYVVDAAGWLFVAYGAVIAWKLSPKRVALSVWRSDSRLHGWHRDEVGSGGLTSIAPDGTQVSTPWATMASMKETDTAFHLVDSQGAVRITLPKRGLPSPDLIPALREYLKQSVGRQPSPFI